jgi:fructose-bisphosphate aldolase class II
VIDSAVLMDRARKAGIALPAFNIAHLPMIEPIIRAVAAEQSLALVEVSRIDWRKFGARSLEAVAEAFHRNTGAGHVRLHLDHVPVLDEDGQTVDYLGIIRRAVASGYQSVMIDGSRLELDENIRITRRVVELAHRAGIPCEAELGAVLGHEPGPLPPYEQLFRSGRGFTDPAEARRFVQESGCDWLSVAIGNIHGAVEKARRGAKKIEARLNLEHLERLAKATGVPLVLHGGSGIRVEHVRRAFTLGIAKINVGTEIRQLYEAVRREGGGEQEAQEALYRAVRSLIRDSYRLSGSKKMIES